MVLVVFFGGGGWPLWITQVCGGARGVCASGSVTACCKARSRLVCGVFGKSLRRASLLSRNIAFTHSFRVSILLIWLLIDPAREEFKDQFVLVGNLIIVAMCQICYNGVL